MSDRVTIRLRELKNTVESFGLSRGLNMSEALRFIIKDYFRLHHENEIKKAGDNSIESDLQDIREKIIALQNENEDLKFNIGFAIRMLLVIGDNDDDLRQEFIKHFPEYFVTSEES